VGGIRGAGCSASRRKDALDFIFLLLFYARPWRHRRRLRHVSERARRRGEPFYGPDGENTTAAAAGGYLYIYIIILRYYNGNAVGRYQ